MTTCVLTIIDVDFEFHDKKHPKLCLRKTSDGQPENVVRDARNVAGRLTRSGRCLDLNDVAAEFVLAFPGMWYPHVVQRRTDHYLRGDVEATLRIGGGKCLLSFSDFGGRHIIHAE